MISWPILADYNPPSVALDASIAVAVISLTAERRLMGTGALEVKPGVVGNVEYDLTSNLRLFGRSGWNGGDSESFAYTEVNNTLALGGDVKGRRWQRSNLSSVICHLSFGRA